MNKKDRFGPVPEDRFHREATLVRVVDGDTLDIIIDLGWSMTMKERVRLEKVDTPEIKDKKENKAGKWVKERVEEFFKDEENKRIIITSNAYERTGKVRGKFGRTIATVYRARDGKCLNDHLLKNKWGWSTDDKGKVEGDRSLTLLSDEMDK